MPAKQPATETAMCPYQKGVRSAYIRRGSNEGKENHVKQALATLRRLKKDEKKADPKICFSI